MAAEESTAMSYEKIYDMGTGLIIAKVQLDKVREQDINARIMKKEMQDQLTANIKNRGQLESLPLLVEKDGVLEIISGHHRIKSARAAGMKEIIAIIDVSGLSRSKIASKQLAHNAISGFDDPSILREICKMLDDVDDMLESYIGKDIMEEPLEQYDIGIEVDGNRQFINESQAELIGWEARLQTGKERKRQIRNFAVNSMPSHYRRYFCKNDWLRAAWLGEEPGWRALVGGEQ